MIRPLVLGTTTTCALLTAGCGSQVAMTSAHTAVGWFKSIDEKDASKARSYFAPEARHLMDWGPASTWSTFTNVDCKTLSATRTQATVLCTFAESPSRSEGQPSSRWSFDLRRPGRTWLIENYGQP